MGEARVHRCHDPQPGFPAGPVTTGPCASWVGTSTAHDGAVWLDPAQCIVPRLGDLLRITSQNMSKQKSEQLEVLSEVLKSSEQLTGWDPEWLAPSTTKEEHCQAGRHVNHSISIAWSGVSSACATVRGLAVPFLGASEKWMRRNTRHTVSCLCALISSGARSFFSRATCGRGDVKWKVA